MDFTKFVSMLNTNSLFFVRPDKFRDPFEGVYSNGNKTLRKSVYTDIEEQELLKISETLDTFNKFQRKFIMINCWHLNDYESAAMWDLYLKSNEGIAIQTTVGGLIEGFSSTDEKIYIGKVNYIDYEKDWIPEDNTFHLYTHKRKSFEYEQEVRALYQADLPLSEGKIDYTSEPPFDFGKQIRCNISDLIENIYVSPTSPSWFYDLVVSICIKFDLQVNVIKSKLYDISK